MKKIIIALLALLPVLRSFAQSDDTTQYTYYRFSYGTRSDRLWANKVLRAPLDTIFSKSGLAILGGTLYVGNGIKWSQVVGGGGSPTDSSGGWHTTGFNDIRYLLKGDSLIFQTKYRSDTSRANIYAAIFAINTAVSGKQAQLSGTGYVKMSGTTPSYVAQIPLGSDITGLLPVANGGTGTATPGLVNGTNVTITGTWPNQTVNSSGGSGDSGLSPVIFTNLSSVNVPLEKIVSGPKRFLYADTISTDPDAMVLQYQLTNAVNAINQTAGSDEWDPAADTVLTFDSFGNAIFKRHSDTTDDATVTVTNTTDAHTVRSKYKVNQAFAYTWSALHGFAAGFTFSASIAPTANGTLDVGSSANNLAAVRSHNFISNGAVAMSSSGTLNRFDINPNGGLAMSFYGNKDVWIGNTTSPSFLNGFRVQRTFQADSGVTLPLIGGSFSTDSNTYHPIGISTAGATVRMSGWPGGGGSFTRQPITSGTSATGTSTTNTLRVLFNFTTTVSAYSFTMPPSPADGQIVEFAGNGTLSYPAYEITTLTIVPNSGQSLSYTIALTTFQAGEFSRWEYFSSTSTWQREL